MKMYKISVIYIEIYKLTKRNTKYGKILIIEILVI